MKLETATGAALDLLGLAVNVRRGVGETDESLRSRALRAYRSPPAPPAKPGDQRAFPCDHCGVEVFQTLEVEETHEDFSRGTFDPWTRRVDVWRTVFHFAPCGEVCLGGEVPPGAFDDAPTEKVVIGEDVVTVAQAGHARGACPRCGGGVRLPALAE